jgi:hypothetical protein
MEWLGYLILAAVFVTGFIWMGRAGGYGEALRACIFSVVVTAIIVLGICLATTGTWIWDPSVWGH